MEHSLQADVRGQLEGVFQYVELLDLPRLPCMDSPRYLKGPGISLLSRTGLQEVLSGSPGLQLDEELWEETGRPILRGESGRGMPAAGMTGPERLQEDIYPGMPSAQPLPTLSKWGCTH